MSKSRRTVPRKKTNKQKTGNQPQGSSRSTSLHVNTKKGINKKNKVKRAAKKQYNTEQDPDPLASRAVLTTFTAEQQILLVGEGDFSFAHALLKLRGTGQGLVATAFDSQEVLLQKYERADNILKELQEQGACVLYQVDAMRLQACLHVGKRKRRRSQSLSGPFDRIIFNFPHVGLGIKDEAVNVQKNRELIWHFLQSAIPLLAADGQIHVAVKTGRPYTLWNVPALAQETQLLRLLCTVPFRACHYPGYHHRRTLGFVEGRSAGANEEIEGKAHTYIFSLLNNAAGF